MSETNISVQFDDFDHALEYQELHKHSTGHGAIVTFTGLVRDLNDQGHVLGLFIEHYCGMTEKSLMNICDKARQRWELGPIRVIHRVGKLKAADQIVFIGVSALHRKNAFDAAQFIMDYLKTNAPFWKQESIQTHQGSDIQTQWVDAKSSDEDAMFVWMNEKNE